MNYCQQCGNQFSVDAKYCGKCGVASGSKTLDELANEVTSFQEKSYCRQILSDAKRSKSREALSQRKYFDSLLGEQAFGGPIKGVTPPNSKGELGHYGNGFMDVLLTQNFIAISSENGGPALNGYLGFKKSTGNNWGVIFPVTELTSVTLNKCMWKMNFSDGTSQEASYYYLVIKPKTLTRPPGSSGFWPLDFEALADRDSFKFNLKMSNSSCPNSLWLSEYRTISPELGSGVYYVGLPFEEYGNSNSKSILACALSKEIQHYPNFELKEQEVIFSNTHHLLVGPKSTAGGFSIFFGEI